MVNATSYYTEHDVKGMERYIEMGGAAPGTDGESTSKSESTTVPKHHHQDRFTDNAIIALLDDDKVDRRIAAMQRSVL